MTTPTVDPDLFWEFVQKGAPDACWPWTKRKDGGGYGVYRRVRAGQTYTWKAHRLAWEFANGKPVPEGLGVLHSCNNPPCCNPAHLRAGTHRENMNDRDTAGRQGDHRGEANGRAKLTAAQVLEIRAEWARGGRTKRGLASRYGVTDVAIGKLLRGENWASVA